ncbi:MAG: cob(I)yrinic acid a,c-diamide adenosyltransferase [Muribaculaceae bacterium]|nr:cob(I)yrinic acid a,c-diamide adenosyltransferase [Muribaculaceae bacterium]
MNRIYTRTGDKGMTAIHSGIRVPKTDMRIEANGTIDELNVTVGAIRTSLTSDHVWQPRLREIQLNLMTLMSLVATVSERRHTNPNHLPDNLVSELERWIDDINSQCTPSEYFILPGGTPLATMIHQARVTSRRAERNLWHLNDLDPLPENILQYVNRLSDLFFIMARYELQHSGCLEEVWREFGYKRKLK